MSDPMPDPEPYSLDFLMSLDPTKLSTNPKDVEGYRNLNDIIQYHRNIRADRASGIRKARTSAATAPASIKKLIKDSKPTVSINRRGM